MGLTKQYLRYLAGEKLNIISSANCNITFVPFEGKNGRYVATGGSEDVIIWDLRLLKKILILEGDKKVATNLCVSPNNNNIAVGYNDGNVKIFEISTGECIALYSGHRSQVTAITYHKDGHYLATGSMDTDVVIWDVLAENGIHRLSEHKQPITQLEFMKTYDIIISASKDSYVKLWNLTNGHCFKTVAAHLTEVWGMAIMKNDEFLAIGSSDSEIRVWRIKSNPNYNVDKKEDVMDDIDYKTTCSWSPVILEKAGSVLREGIGRVIAMKTDNTSQVLCCCGKDKMLEMFYFVSKEEASRRYYKRQRKLKKKAERNEEIEPQVEGEDTIESLRYAVTKLPTIRADSKIKSVDVLMDDRNKLKIVISLTSNAVELHSLNDLEDKNTTMLQTLRNAGHSSDVKVVAFSNDNRAIASGSATTLKIWNRQSCTSLVTVETGYVLSVCFMPGDQHILVGTREGLLLIVKVGSGDIGESISAHDKELGSISLSANKVECITGSNDGTVKLWQIQSLKTQTSVVDHLKFDGDLSLIHTSTLNVTEPVLCARVTPDDKLIAVSLMDSTVKLFFKDTLKFFISLYGHKLPVTCLDISYDSTIIVTGSADRNIKLWGLDYGDCHKSIFAHDGAVTSIAFIPNTHMFFTSGKDGLIKQWDADHYERIATLQGHNGECCSLSVSPDGKHVVSCGSDRVIRLFEKSEEILVLEDERETEREEEEDTVLSTGVESVPLGHTLIKLASKKTTTAEKGAELLLESLDVIKEFNEEGIKIKEESDPFETDKEEKSRKLKEDNKPATQLPLIMTAFNAKSIDEYIIAILHRIRLSELEETLLLLPLSSALHLLHLLASLKYFNYQTEVVTRTIMFLLKVHHKPIQSNPHLLETLKHLQQRSKKNLVFTRDTWGYNLHGLLFVKRDKEEKEGVKFFEETMLARSKENTRKRKEIDATRTALLKM